MENKKTKIGFKLEEGVSSRKEHIRIFDAGGKKYFSQSATFLSQEERDELKS